MPTVVYGTYKDMQSLQKQELEKIQLRKSETAEKSGESKCPEWTNACLRPTKFLPRESNVVSSPKASLAEACSRINRRSTCAPVSPRRSSLMRKKLMTSMSKKPCWVNDSILKKTSPRNNKAPNRRAVNYAVPWQGRANLKVTDRGDKLKRLGSIRKGLVMPATPML